MKLIRLVCLALLLGSSASVSAQDRWMPITPPPAGTQLAPGDNTKAQPYRGGTYSPDRYAPPKNGGTYYDPKTNPQAEQTHADTSSQDYSVNGK